MSLKPNDSTFAGMLAKMIPLPFGRSRWVSRYFVLLDSELRLYKDPVSSYTTFAFMKES